MNFWKICKAFVLLLGLLAAPAASIVAGESTPLLQAGDVVAICGDSITEQKQYSVMIESYLLMCQPAPGLQAHQFGWSGEKADGFLNRMKADVLTFQPSVATIFYGMNDGGYAVIDEGRRETYRKSVASIVQSFKDAGVRTIVVGSPGVVDTFTFGTRANKAVTAEDYNRTLADLGDLAHQVAAGQGVFFADVHHLMAEVMVKAKARHGEGYHVAGGDGIHPARNGHLVIAYGFLKALGCGGDIGTITLDAARNEAMASGGHRVLACADGVVEVESSRYPFCFDGAPADPNGTRGMLEFLPFNQELNRFRFVVSHAPSAMMKVTWGTEAKVFSAEALQTGINLAEEFADHPLVAPFKAVEAAIRKQQEFETIAVKTILPGTANWGQWLPDAQPSLDQLRQSARGKIGTLAAAAQAQVVPVRHAIRCEAVTGEMAP